MIAIDRRALANVARQGAWLGFAALVVLSPFRARIELMPRRTVPVYSDYTDFLLFWSDIAGLVVVGLWLASILLQPRSVYLGPRFMAWPLAVLVIVAWLGVLFAGDVPLAAYNAVRLLGLALLGLYVANEITRLDRIVLPVALMVSVQAIVGIGQVVGQHSLGLSALGEHFLAPGLGVSVITANDGMRYLRAYGLADHPNILGGMLAFGAVIVAGKASASIGRGTSYRVPVFAIGAAALVLTFSRGSWLAFVGGLLITGAMFLAIADRSALRGLGVTCLAGLLVAAPFIAPYRAALGARTDLTGGSVTEAHSVDERLATSDLTIKLLVEHPILGVGIGTLPVAMRERFPTSRYSYQPASVVLLDVSAETGLIGGGAYLVLLISPWLALLLTRPRWTPDLAVASSLLATLTIVGLFDYYTWTYSAGRIWTWTTLGLWCAAYRNAMSEAADAA